MSPARDDPEPSQPAAASDDPVRKEERDAVAVLVDAVSALPPADRDLVYRWLLRRDPAQPVPARLGGWARAAMVAGLPQPDVMRAVQAAGPAGQQMVPVRFPAEQHAQLREWCAGHGFSMATVIRGLVARFLEAQQPGPAAEPSG